MLKYWNKACRIHPIGFIDLSYGVKYDACHACPARKNDCVGVKFEVRKHFIRVGAISIGEYRNNGILCQRHLPCEARWNLPENNVPYTNESSQLA